MNDDPTIEERQESRQEDVADRQERRKALAQRLIEDAVENGVILGALAFTLFTILAVLSFAIIQVSRSNEDSNARLRHGVQCLLFEGIERRQYQDQNNLKIGDALGVDLKESRLDIPPLDLDHALDVCQEFFTEEELQEFFAGREAEVGDGNG